jgi:F-type H+-transporting ATPase subunit b
MLAGTKSLVLAAGEGSFLVQPGLGLMIWTLLVFGITLLILRKYAFPRIAEALERRRRAIEESIDAAERSRKEADELLAEYRKRLSEARDQAEDIVTRARKSAEGIEEQSRQEGTQERERMLADARKEIELETQRALAQIRQEVADLTVRATEKVARKSLNDADHRRLVDEALSEVDFSALTSASTSDGDRG